MDVMMRRRIMGSGGKNPQYGASVVAHHPLYDEAERQLRTGCNGGGGENRRFGLWMR